MDAGEHDAGFDAGGVNDDAGVMDSGFSDAGSNDFVDAGDDGGVSTWDAGPCGDRQFVQACTPLYRCGTQERRPAEGKCDAGFFPVRDYLCGPPTPEGDGGIQCGGCSVQPLQLPGIGAVDDERCIEQCSASHDCTSGTCTQVPAYWGSDTQFMTSVPLCL